MEYVSTRGNGRNTPSAAVLKGLAPDGGLYIYPELAGLNFDWRTCIEKPVYAMAAMILSALLPDYRDMDKLVEQAYQGKFQGGELSPLVKAGDFYVLELFHGPTSAFKDVALSMLPRLMTAGRAMNGTVGKTVILTATSGDTGKAALEGFRDVDGTEIIVFYPDGGVSPVQRAQMVTQQGKNVHVCAVRGNFDDCQRGVKEAFAALSGKEPAGTRLSSANSINIGRLVPQIVYYFSAYAQLVHSGEIKAGETADFSVPTGNFGDILAGYMAKLLGLPVGKLICASNANRVLTDFFTTGIYDRRREFVRTSSPSMDILVSSNLERLLYLFSGCDGDKVRGYMDELNQNGVYAIDREMLARIRETFDGACCDEAGTAQEIGRVWRELGYLCDPHTAVAFAAAREHCRPGHKTVILSTASPYKFPAAVLSAIGGEPSGDEFEEMRRLRALSGVEIPENLVGLQEKPVLHTDVIGAKDITAYVSKLLEDMA